ncbi:MAG: arginase family protein [Nanoarchaeota archaeon]
MFIVKVPGINSFNKKSKGCERAGSAIISMLDEIYSNEQGKLIDKRLLDLEEIHVDNSNLENANELIYRNALEMFNSQDKVIFLGGDHSISFSTVRAFLDYCQNASSDSYELKEPCLLVFDAHPDSNSNSLQGFPDNRNWLKKLVEDGFPGKNILLIGVRNAYMEEREFLAKNNIRIISMSQMREDLEDTCDLIMEFCNRENKEIYLSIDIDIIDPAYAPSTTYPEIGGLTAREFIYLIQRINNLKKLKGIDIVEINSEKDEKRDNLTVKLGAKILSELF